MILLIWDNQQQIMENFFIVVNTILAKYPNIINMKHKNIL